MKAAKSLTYIESDIKEKIQINENITICPIGEIEKENIYEECGLSDEIYNIYTYLPEANYCFEVINTDKAEPYFDMQVLNQTLSLVNKGCSRNILEIYRPQKEISIDIFSSQISNILGITRLNRDDIDRFKAILLKRKVSHDLKLLLIINRYINATSRGVKDIDNNFIELFTALEMLYLDEDENSNIGRILKNRIKKIIDMDLSYYYTTRSKLVHTGERKKNKKETLSDNDFKNAFISLAEIVRVSILKYLDQPELFTEDYLKNICNPKFDKTRKQICNCVYCLTSS